MGMTVVRQKNEKGEETLKALKPPLRGLKQGSFMLIPGFCNCVWEIPGVPLT